HHLRRWLHRLAADEPAARPHRRLELRGRRCRAAPGGACATQRRRAARPAARARRAAPRRGWLALAGGDDRDARRRAAGARAPGHAAVHRAAGLDAAGADDRRDAAAAASRRPLALVRQRDATSPLTMAPWPFPLWIAHRGAGKLAPENTLAAFRLGASHGHTAFECDVKLSADGVLFLLHDDTLDRTTSGRGAAGPRPWAELSRLDAGSWHSAAYAGEPIASFEAIAAYCTANAHRVDLEIKPSPGADLETGRAVGHAVRRLWHGTPVLLSSFKT